MLRGMTERGVGDDGMGMRSEGDICSMACWGGVAGVGAGISSADAVLTSAGPPASSNAEPTRPLVGGVTQRRGRKDNRSRTGAAGHSRRTRAAVTPTSGTKSGSCMRPY
jgi:hypothetical protein